MKKLTLTDPVPAGLIETAEAKGYPIVWGDGIYWGDSEAQSIVDVYDPTPWENTQYNVSLENQIRNLEATITDRMWRENALGSTAAMQCGADDPRTGLTATQYIAWVDGECLKLRSLRRS